MGTQHNQCTSGHIQVMNNFPYYFLLSMIIMLVSILLILLPLKCYYCISDWRAKKITEARERQEDHSVRRASTIREPGRNQEDVWSISIPETSELPSYEELQQANPGKSPRYWSLYNQPVINKQGNIVIHYEHYEHYDIMNLVPPVS